RGSGESVSPYTARSDMGMELMCVSGEQRTEFPYACPPDGTHFRSGRLRVAPAKSRRGRRSFELGGDPKKNTNGGNRAETKEPSGAPDLGRAPPSSPARGTPRRAALRGSAPANFTSADEGDCSSNALIERGIQRVARVRRTRARSRTRGS